MVGQQNVFSTPVHGDTFQTLKESWSHTHRGFQCAAHLASLGNSEPSPGELLAQGFVLSEQGPDGEAQHVDGEEQAQLKKW